MNAHVQAQSGAGGGAGNGGPETATSALNLTVDLTKLTSRGDLLIGFYNPTVTAGSVSSVAFTLVVGGQTLVNKTFASASAASAFFSDQAIGLGSLSSSALSGDTLSLSATLTVTTTAAGQGFYCRLVLGDPPLRAASARFAQHGAAMSRGAGGRVEHVWTPTAQHSLATLTARA